MTILIKPATSPNNTPAAAPPQHTALRRGLQSQPSQGAGGCHGNAAREQDPGDVAIGPRLPAAECGYRQEQGQPGPGASRPAQFGPGGESPVKPGPYEDRKHGGADNNGLHERNGSERKCRCVKAEADRAEADSDQPARLPHQLHQPALRGAVGLTGGAGGVVL